MASVLSSRCPVAWPMLNIWLYITSLYITSQNQVLPLKLAAEVSWWMSG